MQRPLGQKLIAPAVGIEEDAHLVLRHLRCGGEKRTR